MIAQIALPLPLRESFDYKSPFPLQKGMRVLVDFRGKKEVGVVAKVKAKSLCKKELKEIIAPLDLAPSLTPDLLKICRYISENYFCSYGEALHFALPSALRQKRKIKDVFSSSLSSRPKYRPERVYVRENLRMRRRFEVYAQYIEKAFARKKQAVICFPRWQDALAAFEFFAPLFPGKTALLSSFQHQSQQLENWLKIRRG